MLKEHKEKLIKEIKETEINKKFKLEDYGKAFTKNYISYEFKDHRCNNMDTCLDKHYITYEKNKFIHFGYITILTEKGFKYDEYLIETEEPVENFIEILDKLKIKYYSIKSTKEIKEFIYFKKKGKSVLEFSFKYKDYKYIIIEGDYGYYFLSVKAIMNNYDSFLSYENNSDLDIVCAMMIDQYNCNIFNESYDCNVFFPITEYSRYILNFPTFDYKTVYTDIKDEEHFDQILLDRWIEYNEVNEHVAGYLDEEAILRDIKIDSSFEYFEDFGIVIEYD